MYGCPARLLVTIMGMTSNGTPPPSSQAKLVITAAVAIIFGLLIAAVVLGFAGWAVESIIGLLTAIGTIAGALLVILPKLASVQERVEQVAEQTNGVLRAHIGETVRTEVRAALREHLGDPPAQPRRARSR